MKLAHKHALFGSLGAAAALGAAIASAQVVVGGTGFITVSVASVGAVGGGMAGDARLPVTASGARLDPTNNHAHITATGRRGVVRRIEIDVPNARAGQRIELTAASGASIRITLDANQTLGADSRGWVQFDSLAAGRGAGRYEGTFQNGQTPMVVRGQFQVTFSPSVGGPPNGANPGPGPSPGPVQGSGSSAATNGARGADAGRR
ncbi:MAG: hypothetical protein U0269_02385 [Polyangiales bacterium]